MSGKSSVKRFAESVSVSVAFSGDTKGSAAIEYGLVASLIAIAIVAVIAAIGEDIFALFRSIDLS